MKYNRKAIRKVLKELIELNDDKNGLAWVRDSGEKEYQPATIQDLKDFNNDRLASLADYLGMSDLYLGVRLKGQPKDE